MKKIKLLLLLLATVSLSACATKEEKAEDALRNMSTADGYTAVIKVYEDDESVTESNFTYDMKNERTHLEGNLNVFGTMMSFETYTDFVDGEHVSYFKYEGTEGYIKSVSDEKEIEVEGLSAIETLSEDLELVEVDAVIDGTERYKVETNEEVFYLNMKNDKLHSIELDIDSDGYTNKTIIEFIKIGNVTLTIPNEVKDNVIDEPNYDDIFNDFDFNTEE